MATFEATNIVLSKINNLEPEYASKIIGYILIHLNDTEILRLASSPDHVLHNIVLKVKHHLLGHGFSSSSSSPSSPSPLLIPRPPTNPFSGKFPNNHHPISPKSSPLLSPNNSLARSLPKSCLSITESMGSDCFSFLNESLMKNEDSVDPRAEFELGNSIDNNVNSRFHRRSYSASDAYFDAEETGYKPCLYYAKGFCKNGSSCKFVHCGFADSVDNIVGSPNKIDEEIIRLKALQHQRLMSGASSPSSYDKYIHFLMQQQNGPHRAAVMMGDEFHKFNRRNDYLAMVSNEKPNSPSRQIYLTFPAESAFKDEDVSEYFSKFGPVQDVRIPYQQKRMFGFVTFVYPETVRHILSKGNPHFICDSRVLVKPYKEKGKILEKRQQHQQQQLERAEFSSCLSPSGLDATEPYDFHLGARMFYNPQEIMLRRKLEEQAELQQAIELQERRLMNLHLADFKNNHMRNHQRSLSLGTSLPLAQIHSHVSFPPLSSDSIKEDITGFNGSLVSAISSAEQQLPLQEVNPACIHDSEIGNRKEADITDLRNSLEQAFPDSLFASPMEAAEDDQTESTTLAEGNESASFSTTLPSLNKSELKTASGDMSCR